MATGGRVERTPPQGSGRPGLTPEQRRAVETRDVSVALSAGAGCGKTLVLAERFLAALEPDGQGAAGAARLDELVAITFTERAARQMRSRIRRFCRDRFQASAGAEAEHWRDLLRVIDQARVSTIHSFCASLLRRQAARAGLNPRFRVLEAPQAETLLYAAVNECLGRRLIAGDAAASDLAVQFGLSRLPAMVARLLWRRQEIDWDAWRSVTCEELLQRWQAVWREEVLPQIGRWVAASAEARAIREIAGREQPAHAVMAERCAALGRLLADLGNGADPRPALARVREDARVQGGGGQRVWSSPEVFAAFRDAATKLRATIDKFGDMLDFDAARARPAAQRALELLDLAAEVDGAYQARKDEHAALDFDDLILHARRLLADGGASASGELRLLLVDEFQDTDPVQAGLIEALCGAQLASGRLFLVGDVKQSIYRFRRADPRVFHRLRQTLPEAGRLPLSRNFRSQPAILEFVNALFCDDLGEDYEALVADRPQVAPRPAVEFLWAADANGEAAAGEELRRREADWIARRLRAMLDAREPIVLSGGKPPEARPAEQGDVALLFRALSDVAYYEDALRRYGLDYYLVGGHAFYAQQEIFDLVNLLRVVARPADALSLAGALRSPFFNLEDAALVELSRRPGGLSQGILAEVPAELDPVQRRRVEFAAATLRALRALKDRVPVAGLIQEALARTGYDAALLAEFLGERKLANLRKLVERARSFDESGLFTLEDFIGQLADFVARQPDEPLAATRGETTNAVRLMTIHQAKGLEFPVVVVPDLDRSTRGRSAPVGFTPRLGPVVKCEDAVGGFELNAVLENAEDAAELVRLLYVATTRAADFLILSAGVDRLGEWRGPWTQLLSRRFDPLSGKLRVGLPAGYAEPQVKVIRSEPPRPAQTVHAPRWNLPGMIEKVASLARQGGGQVPAHLEPIAADRTAPRRWSFSRLSGAMHESAGHDPAEGEAGRASPDPLGLGTLVHAVLADWDFRRPEELDALVRHHVDQHVEGDARAAAEARQMLQRFAASDRAAAVAGARTVHRELEFLLAWPPNGTGPGRGFIQGFLDCLYEDAQGAWHLLDYKTNRVETPGVARAAGHYEMQMLLYALAVEQVLGRGPEELVLAFLRPGCEHCFAWNTAARRHAMELVDGAMS